MTYKFQFHIGMINPIKLENLESKSTSFQFHIGMINPFISAIISA